MGASLGQQRLGLTYDLHSGIDLGPQEKCLRVGKGGLRSLSHLKKDLSLWFVLVWFGLF